MCIFKNNWRNCVLKNKMTLFELNQKYSACPVRVSEYEIDDKKYVVHSHFVGNKDIDKVISEIAFNRAACEVLKNKAA